MPPPTKLPFGTALALAQRTLTGPLSAVLDAEHVTMPEWFTLHALGLRGPTNNEALSALLATNGLDGDAVRELVVVLDRTGLVEVDDDELVSLTAAGAARHTELSGMIGAVTNRIFQPFDPARVEVARTLLQEIAETDPEQLTRRSVQAS